MFLDWTGDHVQSAAKNTAVEDLLSGVQTLCLQSRSSETFLGQIIMQALPSCAVYGPCECDETQLHKPLSLLLWSTYTLKDKTVFCF